MPTFALAPGTPTTPGAAVSLALTLDVDPDNPIVGDLHLRNGQIHFWDQQEYRRQKVRSILLFFKGEWWLNTDIGIPYFGTVIGGKRRDVILDVFRRALEGGLPDLAKINSLNMVVDGVTRIATVTFELLFDDGKTLNSADFGSVEIPVP